MDDNRMSIYARINAECPCTGCEHEEHCSTGYSCPQFRYWEGKPRSKLNRKLTKVPDQKYP